MKALTSFFTAILLASLCLQSQASGTMTKDDAEKVDKVAVSSEDESLKLQKAAGMLASYEIESKKLLDLLDGGTADEVSKKAEEIIQLSLDVIDAASFRLPQCKAYLDKTMELLPILKTISQEIIEKDYHHDGALPKGPGECYHTKDLLIHPATVVVLTRDDPDLIDATKESITAEITEVLAHTELVRQLVIY